MNKRSSHVMNWRNRLKQKLIEYKGGKCKICGYNKNVWNAYDFHHLDPENKDFSISGKSWSFEKIKSEVDKCDLLCRNCHAEVHWELNQKSREERMKLKRNFCCLEIKKCESCKKDFKQISKDSKFCSVNCANFKRRKVSRPTKEQLEQDIEKLSWVAIGKKYGVSDNATKKWAISYGLVSKTGDATIC